MTPSIEIAALTKRFGRQSVLTGVQFDVPAGSLCGLIGLNGAGKTTTLRILLGLLAPDGGACRVLGTDSRRISTLSGRVGAALHGAGLEPGLKAIDNLRLFAHLHGMPKIDARAVLRRLDLERIADRRVARISQGERQRLALARALMLRPEVLVLDEPLTHLDPGAVQNVVDVLEEEVRERNATVLLSSHQLEHVERSADRLVLIHGGRVLKDATMEELLSGTRRQIEVHAEPLETAERVLGEHPAVASVARVDGVLVLDLAEEDAAADVNSALHAAGARVGLLAPRRRSLDDLFRDLVRAADRDGEAA